MKRMKTGLMIKGLVPENTKEQSRVTATRAKRVPSPNKGKKIEAMTAISLFLTSILIVFHAVTIPVGAATNIFRDDLFQNDTSQDDSPSQNNTSQDDDDSHKNTYSPIIFASIEVKAKESHLLRPTIFQWQCFASSDQPLSATEGLCNQTNTENNIGASSICTINPKTVPLAPNFQPQSIYEVYADHTFNIACPPESYVVTLASDLRGILKIDVAFSSSDNFSTFYDDICDEKDIISQMIIIKTTDDASCIEPWSLDQEPFMCSPPQNEKDKNNSNTSNITEEINIVLMEPCNDGEKWVIESIECPGDIWVSFRQPYAHLYAAMYVTIFGLGCLFASKSHKAPVPFKRYRDYILESTSLWISVVTAIGPLIGCPDYAAYQLYKTQVAIPLLLLDSFEVCSLVLGALFCKTYCTTLDRVRWSGLSKGFPKYVAMAAALFAGVVSYGLNYAIFLSSTQTFTNSKKTVKTSPSTFEAIIRATCGALGVISVCCLLGTCNKKGSFRGFWNVSKFIGAIVPGLVVSVVNGDSAIFGWSAELVLIILHYLGDSGSEPDAENFSA